MASEPTVMVYITCRDEDEARSVTKALLEEKLVACGNMWPVRSLYNWEGRLEDHMEWAALYKTREELADRLVARIKELHSYKVPGIEVLKVDGGFPEYLQWVRDETEPPE